MKEFLRLLRFAAPYRGRMAIALVAMVVYAAGGVLLAWAVKDVFDRALPNQAEVAPVAMMVIAAYALKGIGGYVSGYLMADVGQRVVMDLRNRLFRHILDQSAAFFSRRTTGQLTSHITNDVGQVQVALSETVADLIRESLAVVGFAGYLFYRDPPLALVCLTATPLIVYPLLRLGQRVRRMTRRSQEELATLSHIATEGLAGHRIVKAFGAEAREAERFAVAGQSLYRTNMRVTGALSALPPLMEFIGGLAAAAAIWYGAQRDQRGRALDRRVRVVPDGARS